jgi:hypothetical protein
MALSHEFKITIDGELPGSNGEIVWLFPQYLEIILRQIFLLPLFNRCQTGIYPGIEIGKIEGGRGRQIRRCWLVFRPFFFDGKNFQFGVPFRSAVAVITISTPIFRVEKLARVLNRVQIILRFQNLREWRF